MTSASELFYTRRFRLGRDAAADDIGCDPSSDNRVHHHCSDRRRRENKHRHEFADGCCPLRWIPSGRHSLGRLSHSDRLPARLEQASGHSVSSNSLSPEMLGSIRNRTNERLPGDVLLAKERLLERLRGVSLPENRGSSRDPPGLSHDLHITGNDFLPVDAAGYREPEISSLLSGRSSYSLDLNLHTDETRFPQEPSKKKPPGLTKTDIRHLHFEIFRGQERDMKGVVSNESQDCSICLESFSEGDELMFLPCEHRFHAACLNPWIQTHGDCPYCRRGIVSTGTRGYRTCT